MLMGRRCLIILLAFLPHIALCMSSNDRIQWLPYGARALGSGAITKIGLVDADVMLPLAGNSEQFIFADMMGGYGSNTSYLISPGVGYRNIVKNVIVGGYLFGDRDHTDLGENFNILSPGVEAIGLQWDGHMNGYYTSNRSAALGPAAFSSTYGLPQTVQFEPGTHNQYTSMAIPYAVIGNGVDGEIGYSFPFRKNLRARAYLGGYFYQPPSNMDVKQIRGITAGFTQPVNKYISFSVFNSYDQVSNYSAGIGLTLVFGGEVNVFSNNIYDRFLDPVQRHIGIIGTGAGTYDQRSTVPAGFSLQYDNVFFLAPNGTGNGTYGNPAGLTQATLDAINIESPNSARVYLQGGTGSSFNLDFSADPANHLGLKIYNGQDFYGRTFDYTAPASGANRPIIKAPVGYSAFEEGSFGDSTNQFEDLQLTTTFDTATGTGYGIYAGSNNTSLTLKDVDVSNFAGSGIYVESTLANLNISNDTFEDNNIAIADHAAGTFSISDTLITLTHSFNTIAPGVYPTGIDATNYSSGQAVFNANNLQILFDNSVNNNNGIVLQNFSNGTINANLSNVILSGIGDNGNAFLVQNAVSGGVINVEMQNAVFDALNRNSWDVIALVNATNANATINFSATDSVISNSTGGYGLVVYNLGNASNSVINVTQLSGTQFINDVGSAAGGIFGYGNLNTFTEIHLAGATFKNTSPAVTQGAGSAFIHWIPVPPL